MVHDRASVLSEKQHCVCFLVFLADQFAQHPVSVPRQEGFMTTFQLSGRDVEVYFI